jgi:hypothetical protein
MLSHSAKALMAAAYVDGWTSASRTMFKSLPITTADISFTTLPTSFM